MGYAALRRRHGVMRGLPVLAPLLAQRSRLAERGRGEDGPVAHDVSHVGVGRRVGERVGAE